jgi:hypothetical protein
MKLIGPIFLIGLMVLLFLSGCESRDNYRIFTASQKMHVYQLEENDSGEVLLFLVKSGLIVNGSFITIFTPEEFFLLQKIPLHAWQLKDNVEMEIPGISFLEPLLRENCHTLPSKNITCRLDFSETGLTERFSIFNNDSYILSPTYKYLVENRDQIYLIVAGADQYSDQRYKVQGRLVENFLNLNLNSGSRVENFFVDFGGVSQSEKIIGAPVWIKDKLVGLVSGKTNLNIVVVTPFEAIYDKISN